MDFDIVVIGSGPAGFEAARIGRAAGKTIAVVTETPPGGRATVGSLLPSKIWLHNAHTRLASSHLSPTETKVAAERLRNTITSRVAWSTNQLENAGIQIFRGHATVTGPHSIEIASDDGATRSINGEKIVIATGSEPVFFPGVAPDGARLIAPRHTQHLTEMPQNLVMIGGGVTGVEYASVFAHFGASVHLLSYDDLLPRSDREYVEKLKSILEDIGVTIETGVSVSKATNTGDGVLVETRDGRSIAGDYAFIATGRAGDLTFLKGDRFTLDVDRSGKHLVTDTYGRTSEPSIYACGDITAPPLTANKAVYQGRVAIQHILGHNGIDLHESGTHPLIEAVYTTPQLAGIGPVNELSRQPRAVVHRLSYANSVLSFLDHESMTAATGDEALGAPYTRRDGEVKIWTDSSGTILGASAFGENAAEILAPVQLAMHNNLSVDTLSESPFAYPSWSEIVSAQR